MTPAAEDGEAEVLAAGGVVVREGEDGAEVAVIHRPRYDDWSLPKGKLREGEGFRAAALREVEEETGLRCELGPALPPVRYRDRKGRLKLVRYYRMRLLGGRFVTGDEADEMRWVSLDEAAALLTYGHDRELVAAMRG